MEVILLSDHHGEKLVSLNGYLYAQHSTSGQAIIWRCKERFSLNCPARLRTSVQLTNAVTLNSHTHLPNEIETSAILQLTEEYAGLNDKYSSDVFNEASGDERINLPSQFLEDAVQSGSDYLYDVDALEAEVGYASDELRQVEHDPNDPPFDPGLRSPSSKPPRKQRKRRLKTGSSSRDIGRRKQKRDSESEEQTELSTLSGLFDDTVRKKRKKLPNSLKGPTKKDMPPEPRYVSNIVIEGLWALTDGKNPQRFLLYDNLDDSASTRVILFITDDHLTLLCNARKVHLESALPVPPTLFAQLTLIQVSLPNINYIVTVGYALMGSRSESSYVEVFQALKSKARDLGLTMDSFLSGTVYMDFEKPAINALKKVFGSSVHIEGQFFHLNRIVWKKILDLGLVQSCQVSEDFKLFCAQLVCLAFLPLSEVRQGVLLLKQLAPPNEFKVDLLLDWFDSTFISGAVKASRLPNTVGLLKQEPFVNANLNPSETIELHQTPALFPPERWNVSDVLISSNTRSQNILEGSSWTMKNLIGHTRSSFYRGLKYIRFEEAFARQRIQEYEKSVMMPRFAKRSLVQAQDKLSRLCVSYRENEIDMPTFLLAASKVIRLGEM